MCVCVQTVGQYGFYSTALTLCEHCSAASNVDRLQSVITLLHGAKIALSVVYEGWIYYSVQLFKGHAAWLSPANLNVL